MQIVHLVATGEQNWFYMQKHSMSLFVKITPSYNIESPISNIGTNVYLGPMMSSFQVGVHWGLSKKGIKQFARWKTF